MTAVIGVVGNEFVVETEVEAEERYRRPTLADLLAWLRVELNDVLRDGNEAGSYTEAELTHFLNRAKTEVELRTKCHRARVSVALTAGVHTYSVSPLFGVVEVSYQGATLNVADLEDMANLSQAWDGAAAGTPTAAVQLTGSSLRLFPPPDTGDHPLIVHGYATSEALVATTDAVTSIPVGFASDALLEGAKAFAYKARASHPTNVALAAEAAAKFEALCQTIVQARKAGSV